MITPRSARVQAPPPLSDQRLYWDDRWARQQVPNGYQRRRGDTILGILDALRLERPDILDFGCGTGWFTAELARRGRAAGIDLSEVAIAQARRDYPDVPFVAGTLYESTFADHQFDVVVSQEVIAHVEDPAAYLAIIGRILKPGGYLIITSANRLVMERWDHGSPDPDGHIKRYPTRREFARTLRAHFQLLRTSSIIPLGDRGILRVVNSAKLNRALAHVLGRSRVERIKEWAGFGYSLVALARKRP